MIITTVQRRCLFQDKQEEELNAQKEKFTRALESLDRKVNGRDRSIYSKINIKYQQLAQLRNTFAAVEEKIKTSVKADCAAEKRSLELKVQLHNNQLKQLNEQFTSLHLQTQQLSQEYELGKQKVLEKHDAIKYVLYLYQTALNIKLNIETIQTESTTINVYFLCESGNPCKYVKLTKNQVTELWELDEMQPQPANFRSLVDRLSESQDIIGLVSASRTIFQNMKSKHVLCNNDL